MYEQYEPSESVFVDREEYLEWMEEALERCKKECVVLHLRGIGGIGKSSLVEHWNSSVENGVILDLSRVSEFYDRLDVLAKSAVRFGIRLRRFDALWHIRQRFIKGVEPLREKGRGWVLGVLAPIDAIGIPVVSVSRAISVIGQKLKPILTGKLDDLGNWLQTRLGEEYTERLLEVLWKEPSHAEFLYLDALVEDLNNRKEMDKPVLVMLDGFEVVDNESLRWRYGGRNISESELWYIFLSSLKNCVGIVASRQPPPPKIVKDKMVEESELTELDEESCRELLDRRGIPGKDLQTKIISVSGGNPFVINCICDIQESAGLSIADVEKLGADTLKQVRVKTWRRLFRETEGLLDIIDRAGLVSFIDRHVIGIIAPSMKSAHWDRLTRLSFVRDRGDGTWTLHDLARELVLAELEDKLESLTDEVANLLEMAAVEQSDTTLSGMALSVRALAAEPEVIATLEEVVEEFITSNQHKNAISLLDSVTLSTDEGKAVLQRLKGTVYAWIGRVGDAEEAFREAVRLYRELAKTAQDPDAHLSNAARTLDGYGTMLRWLHKPSKAEKAYGESIGLYRDLAQKTPDVYMKDVADTLCNLASLLGWRHRPKEAEEAIQEALQLYRELAKEAPDSDIHLSGIANTLLISQLPLLELDARLSEAEEAGREALGIYRGLAEKAPDIYLWKVADALWYTAMVAWIRHRVREAEEMLRERLRLFRGLAKMAPDVFLLSVADSALNLGKMLYSAGRASEAQEPIKEALRLFRELAQRTPDVYSEGLGWTIIAYGNVLRETGRLSESEEAFREGIGIYQELARKLPEVFSRGECSSQMLAHALRGLGHLLRTTGRLPQAEEAFREALALCREIAKQIPAPTHTFLVSQILHDLAIILRKGNRGSEAEEALREALEIFRGLAEKMPDVCSHHLASTLNNLALILRTSNRVPEAEKAFREALEIFQCLSEKAPEMFLPHVAATLSNLGILLKQSDRTSESEAAFSEVLEIQKSRSKMTPELSLPCVATSLNNLGIILSETGRSADAEESFREALGLRRELAKIAPELYIRGIASVHNNLGVLFKRTNEPAKAKAAYRESLMIWDELFEKDPDINQSSLVRTLSSLHTLFVETGREKATKQVMTRLQKLGVKSLPDDEEWSQEEEGEDTWFWSYGIII